MERLLRQTADLLCLALFVLMLSSCATSSSGAKTQGDLCKEYYSIASEYETLKKYDKALNYYTKALESDELYDASYYRMGICYVQQKNWLEAQKVFLYFIDKDSQNESIKLSLAYVYAMSGETDKALNLYDELYTSGSTSSSLLKNYTAVLIKAEQYEKAAEILEDFKQKYPDDKSIVTLQKNIPQKEEGQQP